MRVTGLGSAELSSLRNAQWSPEEWSQLLKVTVGDSPTPIIGRYAVAHGGLEFSPRFPLDPGRSYVARFDPVRLPRPRQAPPVTTSVSIPAGAEGPATAVAAIYPSGDTWPANLLRFYVHFSGFMSRSNAAGRVRILEADGTEVRGALLPSDANLWNDDQTRYTLLFDPGRVKRGILPNRLMGRPLLPGHRYIVDVDAAWPDVRGRPLAGRVRKEIVAGPPIERALDISTWRVTPPKAGTTAVVSVAFPHPLDHALLIRTVGITVNGTAVPGEIAIGPNETEWRFTPAQPWQAGRYEVVALSILEDPSGNRINRPFEVDAVDESDDPEPQRYSLPFEIR